MIGLCVFGHGQCGIFAWNRNRCSSKPLCKAESLRDLVPMSFACAGVGRRFNMDRRPLRAQTIGHAFGMAHDGIGSLRRIDHDKYPLAR
jgi:hypothetical protein